MFVVAPTNPEENFMRYVRASNKFQEYLSGVWTDKVLAVAGGGTGGATQAAAKTALGIGTMGSQDSNAVAITGGSATGLSSLGVTGAVDFAGGAQFGSGNVNLVDGTGKIPALSSTYFASLSGANLTALPAAQLTGTVPTATLGSGTANSSTFLRGDQTWAAPVGTVPSGLIAIFITCPSGWTRITQFDDRFLMGAAVANFGPVGGAATHSHVIDAVGSHTHSFSDTSSTESSNSNIEKGDGTNGVSSRPNAGHTHGVSGTTGSGGGHTHTEQVASSLPPYCHVVFCMKD